MGPKAAKKLSIRGLSLLADGELRNRYGAFDYFVYTDGCQDALVLTSPGLNRNPPEKGEVICRIHSSCVSSHVFLSTGCDCAQQMEDAFYLIANNKQKTPGVVIHLAQEGKGNGIAAYVASVKVRRNNPEITEAAAYEEVGFPNDQRSYDIAAKILHELKVDRVQLITDNKKKRSALERAKIKVLEVPTSYVVRLGPSARSLLTAIKSGQATNPVAPTIPNDNGPVTGGRVVVIGDLNVDYYYDMSTWIGDPIVDLPEANVGGTAFNAASAFQDAGLSSILVGAVGNDADGKQIIERLQSKQIRALIRVDGERPTGSCHIIKHEMPDIFNGQNRVLIKTGRSANTYDISDIGQALDFVGLTPQDRVFLVAHGIERIGTKHMVELVKAIRTRSDSAKLIVDLVPHDIFLSRTLDDVQSVLKAGVDVLVSELHTLFRLAYPKQPLKDAVSIGRDSNQLKKLVNAVRKGRPRLSIVVRYGFGHCQYQRVVTRSTISEEVDTGYGGAGNPVGFGDKLTGTLLAEGVLS